ncbi:UNVERIFIED_CONTAM: hypothetical protein GTU68_064078 [Idotea baltica]|nr:hypothetical protein [Idotea baltica]
MIFDTVSFFTQDSKEVVFDAEHFFDGYLLDPNYALACLEAAVEAGASSVVLCDTNGGSLPMLVEEVVRLVSDKIDCTVGIHTHNDGGCAVANSIVAVNAGARQVQGTINGYGERCGNANLISVIPALFHKLNYRSAASLKLSKLSKLSRTVAEMVNENHISSLPYVGRSAFAHKGGLHVAAVERIPESYEHIEPELVGNVREIVISELSGRGTVRLIAKESGVQIESIEKEVLELIKEREHQGYAYESAEGSAELLMRKISTDYVKPFELLEMNVFSKNGEQDAETSQATLKLSVLGELMHTVADGSGPIDALDQAIRKALLPHYPLAKFIKLSNYKVRIIDPGSATRAKTRVMIEACDKQRSWVTVGCSENIIVASCEALLDSYELYLSRMQNDEAEKLIANDNRR